MRKITDLKMEKKFSSGLILAGFIFLLIIIATDAKGATSYTKDCILTDSRCTCFLSPYVCGSNVDCIARLCVSGCPAAGANSTYASNNCAISYGTSCPCIANECIGGSCSCSVSGNCTYNCNSGYQDCDGSGDNGCECSTSAPAPCCSGTVRYYNCSGSCYGSSCPSCPSSCSSSENCATKSTYDSDGNAPYTGGYVRDYVGCSGGSCTSNTYADTCIGILANNLREYLASGSTYTYQDYTGGTSRYCYNTTYDYFIDCAANTANCDQDPVNACECSTPNNCCGGTGSNYPYTGCSICSDLTCATCPANCTQGATCDNASHTQICQNGSCVACASGYASCDVNSANGCEINLNTDNNNCGDCGIVCSAGYTCTNGVCTAGLKANGESCTSNTECTSGYCVDGVCCNSSCAGTCQACNLTGSLGTCKTRSTEDNVECGTCYRCNGTNTSCQSVSGQEGKNCTGPCMYCSAGSCTTVTCDEEKIGVSCSGLNICDNTGSCVSKANDGSSCQVDNCPLCSSSISCLFCASNYCGAGGTCTTPSVLKSNGQSCTSNTECTSGYCVDGVCCNSACTGTCQACNLTGYLGACQPVSGQEGKNCTGPCMYCSNGNCLTVTCDEEKIGVSCSGLNICDDTGSCVSKANDGSSCQVDNCPLCSSSISCLFCASNFCGSTGTCSLSPLGFTVSGNAYEDEGKTVWSGCDETSNRISLRVGRKTYRPVSCSATNGAFSFSNISPPSAGAPMVIWFDGVSGNYGSTINRYFGSGNVNGIVVRRNKVIIQHDDQGPITNADLGIWDNDNDHDINYLVDAFNNLTIEPGSSLIINTNTNFTPGGKVKINGDLLIMAGATLISKDDISVLGGDVTGDGKIDLTGGKFLLAGTGNFEGNSGWRFHDLTFGDGSKGVTSKIGNGNIEITNILTILANQTLRAGSPIWTLAGSENPFSISGNFEAQSSLFKYTGTSNTNIPATTYYRLELSSAGPGSPSYTIGSGTLVTNDYLYIGDGKNPVRVSAAKNDPSLDIIGNFEIRKNSTFIAPSSAVFSVAGNWLNSGAFGHSSGILIFDGKNVQSITCGGSNFHILEIKNSSKEGINFLDSYQTKTFLVTTPSARITFSAGSIYSFENINLNGFSAKTRILLRGSGSNWLLNLFNPPSIGNQSVSFVDVKDSNASLGTKIDASNGTNLDSGNNKNWNFFVPKATSVSHSPDPVDFGSKVTFIGKWQEPDLGDKVKTYICKDPSCFNCNNNSQTNCWCYSKDWNMAPDTSDACDYTPESKDREENSYWLGVCDDLSLCDPVPLAGGKFKVQGLPIEKPSEEKPPPPSPSIIEKAKEVLEGAKENFQETVIKPVQETIETIRENPKVKTVVENPAVDTTVKTTVSVGVGTAITTGLVSLMPFASRIFDFIFLPQRILQFLGIVLFRKKAKPWGVVYDSFTKQPLDPVYVVLKDKEGKEVDSKITDLNGRFGFLVPPGQYYLEVNKTHYKFPSEKVKGIRDELYENLYHGEPIEVTDPTLISLNVPMDPLDFDWNEVSKRKIIKFNYHWELVKRWLPSVIFYLGFLLTFIFFVLKPSPFNFVMIWIYVLLFILRKIGFKERHWGLVLDKKKKKPWPFSILTVFYEKTLHPIKQTTCDVIGRYYALVEPGRYDVAVERKVKDEYQFAGKYPSLKAKKGIINKDLLIEVKD